MTEKPEIRDVKWSKDEHGWFWWAELVGRPGVVGNYYAIGPDGLRLDKGDQIAKIVEDFDIAIDDDTDDMVQSTIEMLDRFRVGVMVGEFMPIEWKVDRAGAYGMHLSVELLERMR